MKTKNCRLCNKDIPIENFPIAGKQIRCYCNECWKIKNREYRKTWHARNKKKCSNENTIQHKKRTQRNLEYVNSKKLECSKCGYNKCKNALDFHHIGTKRFNISNMVQRAHSIENIKKELDNCIVLCANCHRELHDTGDEASGRGRHSYKVGNLTR